MYFISIEFQFPINFNFIIKLQSLYILQKHGLKLYGTIIIIKECLNSTIVSSSRSNKLKLLNRQKIIGIGNFTLICNMIPKWFLHGYDIF